MAVIILSVISLTCVGFILLVDFISKKKYKEEEKEFAKMIQDIKDKKDV